MKRIVVALLVLMFAAPAWAEVQITCWQVGEGPNDPNVIVSFVNTEPQHVRSFALDITADGKGKIIDVNCISTDYYLSYVYPVAVEFNGAGEVANWRLYDVNSQGVTSVTVQLVWLYDPNDPDHNTPPADEGDLLSITLDEDYCTSVAIDPNELLGGVVMEDGNSVQASGTSCWVGPRFCMHCDSEYFPMWIFWGMPECWCYDCFPCGDSNNDRLLTFADVSIVIAGWPPNPHEACADYSRDGQMTFEDVGILIANWPPNGGCDNCTPLP